MVRPTWRAAISFGLVNVPVQLHTAVRRRDLRFRQLTRDDHQPVKNRRVDAALGEEVSRDDIVKGYELAEDHYVVVDPDELDRLAPESSRSIDIHDYVEASEIDPVYYDRSYYLTPDGDTATKPYQLLTEAMQRTGKVAIARFVMRNKEHLGAIRADDGLLVLSTIHYADEVVDRSHLDELLPDDVQVRDREVEMAEQLIASMTTGFCPTCYENEHRQRVKDYLEAKAADDVVELPREDRESGDVLDLVAALERSLGRERTERHAAAGAVGDDDAGANPYAQMTRAELYELAKQRDIPGRSNLAKPELIDALEQDDTRSGAA